MDDIQLRKSMNDLFSSVIRGLWQQAQVHGMTEYYLCRQLNWSRNRLERTIKSPVFCRGGLKAACKVMTHLGVRGFRAIEGDFCLDIKNFDGGEKVNVRA